MRQMFIECQVLGRGRGLSLCRASILTLMASVLLGTQPHATKPLLFFSLIQLVGSLMCSSFTIYLFVLWVHFYFYHPIQDSSSLLETSLLSWAFLSAQCRYNNTLSRIGALEYKPNSQTVINNFQLKPKMSDSFPKNVSNTGDVSSYI